MLAIFIIFFGLFFNLFSDILILTKGSGGDFNGAKIIHEKLTEKKKKNILLNLDNEKMPDLLSYNNIIIIGQGATNEAILNFKQSDFIEKNIAIYSHIVDDNLKKFLLQNCENSGLKLFITFSEKSILKNEMQNCKIQFINAKFPIQTVNSLNIKKFFNNKSNIIWIGGSYKNSKNESIKVTRKDFILSLRNLKKLLNKNYQIKIILSPRTLSKGQDYENKMKINDILNIFPYAKIMLPKDYIEILKINKKNFLPYFDYNSLINYFNNITIHNQYATVDQYNIFSDLEVYVYPFLLKNDENQFQYQKIIKLKKNKKDNLTNKIIDNF